MRCQSLHDKSQVRKFRKTESNYISFRLDFKFSIR